MSTATLTRPPEPLAEDAYWEDDDGPDTAPMTDGGLLDRVADGVEATRSDDRLTFELLADDLESATLGVGSTRRITRHPAYAEILSIGEGAIPLLLERLEQPGARPVWLRTLSALTSYQPGAGQKSVTDAAAEWIRWGKLRGYA